MTACRLFTWMVERRNRGEGARMHREERVICVFA